MAENDMPDKPELQLITDSRNGDMEAMAELFRRHYPLCIRIARRILPACDDYSDAVQSAYLSAFRHIQAFRGDSSFKSWITRIVINHCLMHLRKSARVRPLISLDDAGSELAPVMVRDTAPTPEELMQMAEVQKTVTDAVRGLPQSLRRAFDLSISGHSIVETANVLGLTVAATKTRLFRARAYMRSTLGHLREMPNRTSAYGPAVRLPIY